MIYVQLLLVTFIVIYVVDLSGFTDTLLDLVSAWRGRKVSEFKPFTCSLCMTWWCCLLWALCTGCFSLAVVAYSALLSAFSAPIGQLLSLLREMMNAAMAAIANRLGL